MAKLLLASFIGFLGIISLSLISCEDDATIQRNYETEYVVVIVVDGPRYSETWGDPTHANIPFRSQLLSQGVLASNFRNNGTTFTNPGHTSMFTGTYQNIANNGSELPSKPTLFQELIRQRSLAPTAVSIITSKDKLHVLRNSTFSGYEGNYLASFNCGGNGDGTGGYRADSITFNLAKLKLQNESPILTHISFKEPDASGHLADSLGYINGIIKTDQYINELWQIIQANPKMSGKTTLIVTNDHGRHSDGILNGFVSHGDDCDGCRHIEFFAVSPDFKQNYISTIAYEQIDVAHTVAELLHIRMKEGVGKVMWDLFK
jgi:Sulfatase